MKLRFRYLHVKGMVPAQLLQLVDEGRNLRISIEKYGQELEFIQEFELLRSIDFDFNQGIRLVSRFEPKCVRPSQSSANVIHQQRYLFRN